MKTDKCTRNTKLYEFSQYKKKKPFFTKKISIYVGEPISDTYILSDNLVYNDKQILALTSKKLPFTILLVEGTMEDGKLIKISKLSDEEMNAVIAMLR